MKENSIKALDWVFKDEGGFAIRNEEGGGAVNKGITFSVFSAWRLLHGKPEPTFDDLKIMTKEEAEEIYKAQYFPGSHFEDLPAGVDYCQLDASINGGVTGSVKILQAALNLTVDGHYGLVTRWAANHRDVPTLINKVCEERLRAYKAFPRWFKIANPDKPVEKQVTWGTIWSNRIAEVRKRSLAMAQAQQGSSFVAPATIAVPVHTLPAAQQPAPIVPKETTIVVAQAVQPMYQQNPDVVAEHVPSANIMPASTEISKGMIKQGYVIEEFLEYLESVAAKQMSAFRPRGVVLHNTGKINWPGVVNGKAITPEQRLDNMSVGWTNAGFKGAPHLVLPPDGLVWLAWPLWKPGTHSPSWNSSYWGIEMVGDFRVEKPTDALLRTSAMAMAGMYRMIGQVPDDAHFKLHKEDPRTTHKDCPGELAGTKQIWMHRINTALNALDPAGL